MEKDKDNKKDLAPDEYIELLKYSGVKYVCADDQAVEMTRRPAESDVSSLSSLHDEAGEYESFDQLRSVALACEKCGLSGGRTNVVFGDGNPNADLLFIGEGPGHHEDIQGKPFVGRAGKLLDKMIIAMGFKREEVYIANIVKCRPPENRNPLSDEVTACLPYLKAQIAFIKPKIIVLLGGVAVRSLLKTKEGITKIRGSFIDYHGTPLVPVYHPAYLLRSPGKKKEAWEDLQKVMAFLDGE